MAKELDLNELDMKVIMETKKNMGIDYNKTSFSFENLPAVSSDLLDLKTDNNRNNKFDNKISISKRL